MDTTCHMDSADLQDYIKKVFGTDYIVSNDSRMYGGAQKVVYKIDCVNGFSCVLYVWDLSHNYFKEEILNNDINRQSYGSDLFEMNNKYLLQHGIRTPLLYDLDKRKEQYPFDYALVEYVDGQKAEFYFEHPDSRVRDQVFQQVGDMITRMHSQVRPVYGKVYGNEISTGGNCHHIQLENAKLQLSFASQHVESIQINQDKLLNIMYELESRIRPRHEYGFIHGELGPDHILVNDKLEPFLIDIEGGMFFDIEHEHSFLELRFGDFYRYVKNNAIDSDRMIFYRLHHHLSLISGGLKLLHRGFPDQAFAKGLIHYHTECAMKFI